MNNVRGSTMLGDVTVYQIKLFSFQIANNKGADQTVQKIRRVIVFVARMQQNQISSQPGPYSYECQLVEMNNAYNNTLPTKSA